MGSPAARDPERGLRSLFFAYFAYVGGFSPYLSLYLAHSGFGAAQIGILMTLPQALRIVAPPVWGRIAERAARRVPLLTGSAAAAVLLMLALLPASHGFAWTAVVLAALYFATAGQMPIVESMTLTATAGDAGRYGRIRLWGSIGFIAAVTVIGPVLDRVGVGSLPAWGALLLAVVFLVERRMSEPPPPVQAGPRRSVRGRLREWPIAGFFTSAFLMIFAHAAFYAFFSLYLELKGYSKTAIGAIWAFGVLAEIAVFRWQRPLFLRLGAPWLLSASLLVAAVRFALIGASDGNVWLILLTQAMHAVTFGVHHSACMSLMHRWFDEAQQPRAQALFVTVSYGLGGTLGGLAVSALWVRVGPEAAFIGAGVAALLGWLAALPCRQAAV